MIGKKGFARGFVGLILCLGSALFLWNVAESGIGTINLGQILLALIFFFFGFILLFRK